MDKIPVIPCHDQRVQLYLHLVKGTFSKQNQSYPARTDVDMRFVTLKSSGVGSPSSCETWRRRQIRCVD